MLLSDIDIIGKHNVNWFVLYMDSKTAVCFTLRLKNGMKWNFTQDISNAYLSFQFFLYYASP